MSEAFSYDGELEEVTEFQAEDGKKKGKSALSTQTIFTTSGDESLLYIFNQEVFS